MSYLVTNSMEPFASAYPLSPALLRHGLAGHPLLTFDALARASLELPPQHVERRIADAENGGEFAMDRSDDADPAAVIRSIGDRGNWVMLRFVEQLPAYRELLHTVMESVGDAIAPVTGRGQAIKGFIFVSAPGTLTPFHFDCEYNILFQIAGDKDFAIYPPCAPWLPPDRHEAYYSSGDNMLPWRDTFGAEADVRHLRPGDAVFVPHASPHWVKVGAEPSISLSVTWQSEWSRATGDAMLLNPLLRRCGLPARAAPQWPATPKLRALGYRLARKMGLG